MRCVFPREGSIVCLKVLPKATTNFLWKVLSVSDRSGLLSSTFLSNYLSTNLSYFLCLISYRFVYNTWPSNQWGFIINDYFLYLYQWNHIWKIKAFLWIACSFEIMCYELLCWMLRMAFCAEISKFTSALNFCAIKH